MKTELVWTQKLGSAPIFKVATSDSERIFAACGTVVQVMNKSGEITKTIQTQHTQNITYLAVNNDGQKIVTVGLDNQVIFIDPSGTALFKYTHNTEIQCCAFSPNNEYFLTCADQDIGVYAQGAQKVQKYKVDGLSRACCWAANSAWFAVSNQAGTIIMMDIAGVEFNKIEIGAPIWCMEIKKATELQNQTVKDDDSDDDDVQMNEVGVFNEGASNKQQVKKEDGDDFISKNKISEDRLIILSWDQKYRVLNPSISGNITKGKQNKMIKKPSEQLILAEAKLPFIPLTMQIISNYVIVAGVGGKIVFLNSETGAHLIDLIQINENDPFIIGAPRGVKNLKNENLDQITQNLGKNQSLSWFGFNSVWIYSITRVSPNYLFIALNTGVICCVQFQFNAVDALYKNFYAVREGLTSIHVKNLTTISETTLDTGVYIQKLAIYQTKLAVLSGQKLSLYDLQDTQSKKNIESVLRNEGNKKMSTLFLQFIKSHKISFSIKFLALASNHFLIAGNDYVTAFDFNGVATTSWKFKNCQINNLKIIGGIQGQENLILSTQDGRVLLLKIGNRFPVEAIKHNFAIINCDISANRDLIAILDSQRTLSVFDYFSTTKTANTPLYQITSVSSLSFDLVLPNILSFSSDNKINICINGTIVYTYNSQQPNPTILLQNGSINFNFSLQSDSLGFSISSVNLTEIPLTPNITHHVKRCYISLAKQITFFDFKNELNLAIQAANLGAPANYWQEIAVCGLFCGEIELAKEALSSVGNVRVLKNLSEIAKGAKGAKFQHVALALSLSGHFQDASMLFAASGDMAKACELLYFVRQDGIFEVGPNSSLISLIVQNMIQEFLQPENSEIQTLPNLAIYYKLGTSDEDIIRYKTQLLQEQKTQQIDANQYVDFLQIYEQNDANSTGNGQNSSSYSYSSDYRILLRRQLQALCKTPQERNELLTKHASFLQQIHDWQASSSSYMDAQQPEKAVQVLISNNQTQTLLKLVRILPPLQQKQQTESDEFASDFNFEPVKTSSQETRIQLQSAFSLVLGYFEKMQDFDSALFIAQRLNDAASLLRILAAQNRWDLVENLAKIYPEMASAVHEARANQLLKEGRFMEALERLKMAGNSEKEIAMIRALTDASIVECKFEMARSLVCELCELVVKMRGNGVFHAVKSLRSKILCYSGFGLIEQYVLAHFGSPDPRNLNLMKIDGGKALSAEIVSVCTFLTCFDAQPVECANFDVQFLVNFESLEMQDQDRKNVAETTYISSSSKPQLGSLSSLDLGASGSKSLPSGVPESVIWLSLIAATSDRKTCQNALKRLISTRLPQKFASYVRHEFLASKGGSQPSIINQCPRCGNPINPLPPSSVLTQRDLDILSILPMCSPSISDVCGSCGIPIVRSAISLRILPLILIEHCEESSILELIESASSVQIGNERGQIIQVESDNLQQILKEAPVVNDGRGVQVGKDCYAELNPAKIFILDDRYTDTAALPDLSVEGVVKRVFVLNDEELEVHYCYRCCFFFESQEFEMAVIMGGQCPICGCKDVVL
ncbi:Intraflagellar transport protein 122 [Spironucleus salmonicida]|uniref:Intraflagellar transport protein 122 n=1 Tax=Spironucleus salmonicida TaxID=348837 RepID=V6LHS2_9EUKA|nr:Intraflagellar transport protein 122 [Spironucleus salmonicida]|eukprot:EST44102.1 Intraflagellar transport protein 122 [Spironucleus salmonicida]